MRDILRGLLYIEAILLDVLRARLGDDADVVVKDLDSREVRSCQRDQTTEQGTG